MNKTDLQIKDRVQRILARHWIDTSDLRFTCTQGTIRFNGTVRRVAHAKSRSGPHANKPLLELISMEIRSTPGVKKVYFLNVTLDDALSRV